MKRRFKCVQAEKLPYWFIDLSMLVEETEFSETRVGLGFIFFLSYLSNIQFNALSGKIALEAMKTITAFLILS